MLVKQFTFRYISPYISSGFHLLSCYLHAECSFRADSRHGEHIALQHAPVAFCKGASLHEQFPAHCLLPAERIAGEKAFCPESSHTCRPRLVSNSASCAFQYALVPPDAAFQPVHHTAPPGAGTSAEVSCRGALRAPRCADNLLAEGRKNGSAERFVYPKQPLFAGMSMDAMRPPFVHLNERSEQLRAI